MKKGARKFFIYCLYIAFGMALTTTAVWAMGGFRDLGRCYGKDEHGRLARVSCICQHPISKQLKKGTECGECEHILAPASYPQFEPAMAR